jgi:hypothetical protein
MEMAEIAQPLPAPALPQSRFRLTLGVIAFIAIANTVLVALAPDPQFSLSFVLASLLLWVSVYPCWHHFANREPGIPYLPAMAAIYFCYYGLPAFRGPLQARGLRLPDAPVETALELALVGLLLLYLGFYATRTWTALPRARLALDLPRNAMRLLLLAVASEVARLLATRGEIPIELGQWVKLIMMMPTIFFGGMFLLLLRGKLPRVHLAVGLALLFLHLMLDFATGSIAVPLQTIASLMFLYVAERVRVPLVALLAVALVVIPSLGTKLEYRRIIARHPEMTYSERIELFAGLVHNVFVPSGKMTFRDAGDAAESRTDHLSAFAYVISRTPSSVPYWGGETYSTLLTTFIPRVLYPDKPQKTLGQDYGHRYHFIGPHDKTTSINLEQTVEMYANFGVKGVLIGMLLMGFVYSMLYRVLNHAQAGDGGILIAAHTFTTLLNIESDVSLVFGAIVQEAVLLALVLYLVAHPRPAPAGGPRAA